MKKITRICNPNNESSKEIHLNWQLTDWCNYRCSYCYQNNTSRKWIEYNSICDTADKINILLDKLQEPISLHMLGGEITYYDLIDLFSNHLTSKYLKKVVIITNLSRDITYFNNLFHYMNLRNISLKISASFHEEYFENNTDFFEKAALLNSPITIVVSNKNKECIDEVLTNLKDRGYNLDKITLSQDSSGIGDGALQILDKWSGICGKKGFKKRIEFDDGSSGIFGKAECQNLSTNFYGYKCTRFLRIDNNRLRSGTCSVVPRSINLDEIINHFNKEDVLKLSTVICTAKFCPFCGFQEIVNI